MISDGFMLYILLGVGGGWFARAVGVCGWMHSHYLGAHSPWSHGRWEKVAPNGFLTASARPLMSASLHPLEKALNHRVWGVAPLRVCGWQLCNFSIILTQCKCLGYLCGFILHLLFGIIDLYLSLLDLSNSPPLLLFHFIPLLLPLRSASSLENLKSISQWFLVSAACFLPRKPCLAAEGQTGRACLALLGKLFNAVTLIGIRVALVTFIRAPLVG